MVLRKRVSTSAALILAVVSTVSAATSDTPAGTTAGTTIVEPFRMLDWKGFNQISSLADGTSLYRYVAQSSFVSATTADSDASNRPPVNLRISFLPRFRCTPLVSVFSTLPENISARERVSLVRNFNQLELTVDDEPIQYPALVEIADGEIHSYFDAALERRTTLRILVELGNRLQISFGDGRQETLSLLGSQRVLETALGRCKKHS